MTDDAVYTLVPAGKAPLADVPARPGLPDWTRDVLHPCTAEEHARGLADSLRRYGRLLRRIKRERGA